MEQDQSPLKQLPPLSSNHAWFVSQNLEQQHFYTLPDDGLPEYQCKIPELFDKRIRGYYHGWVVISDRLQSVLWSLWNPVTSDMIDFPALILKDGDSEPISECCLSAPPEDPSSVLVLARTNNPTFVFRRVKGESKSLDWDDMIYTTQLKSITDDYGDDLHSLTYCNGKIYALSNEGPIGPYIIQLDISLVEDKQVSIELSLVGNGSFPVCPSLKHFHDVTYFLKGHSTELFIFTLGFHNKTIEVAQLIKLDLNTLNAVIWEDAYDLDDFWKVVADLKDAIFFVDLGRDNMVCYRPKIASKLGGYIHIREKMDTILYSYHVKEKTISLSYMPSLVLPTSNVSLWECRLEDGDGGSKCNQEENQIVVRSVIDNETGTNECNLLNLPSHILETIIQLCGSVEYLNFRATCKSCKVAAPLNRQTCSLLSPWLMVVVDKGRITYTDPMLGGKYFMRNKRILDDDKIYCSGFGWLLCLRSVADDCLSFCNFFTDDELVLPYTKYRFTSACFSAPPTSSDWMVAGFSEGAQGLDLLYCVCGASWQGIHFNAEPSPPIGSSTFFGLDLYALDGDGKLIGFKELGEESYSYEMFVEATVPLSSSTSPARYYLIKRDQDILKVIVGKFGERVEVFRWEVSKQEWEKINSLGNHTIYICETTCLCIKSETREMENMICFPMLHSKKRKMLFYSLETGTFQTFNGENLQHKDFFGTTYHLSPHTWVEPSWA